MREVTGHDTDYRQAVKNMAAIEHENNDQLELLKA